MAIVVDLSLEQLVPGPQQLRVLGQVVSLGSCAWGLLGVPGRESAGETLVR